MPILPPESLEKAKALFRKRNGYLRTSEALRLGISPRTLYAMREAKLIEPVARGLYRLADSFSDIENDLAMIALKVPTGVICLVSALAYHEITTQIPHQIDVALDRNTKPPRMSYPPIRVHRFSQLAYQLGVEHHRSKRIDIKVYDVEKTLIDCFRNRNSIGMDIVLEAFKLYRKRRRFNIEKLLDYSQALRIAKTISPYLESLA